MTQIETNNEIEDKKSLNFIEQIVEADLKAGKNGGRLNTRFPPEPNGYLHIGHAKAICMDFGIAEKFGGTCNLRFDDTNPVKEDVEYVDSIMEDIHWLGFDWGDRLYYASDYFPKLWDLAIRLIKEGKAYVDEQSSEEIARQKGTPTQPGIESPYRNRSVEENLDLFERMNKGEFEEGRFVLRAKIDMASPNMHFRDPIMYRIIKHPHHRTGTKWNVYPMYDFAHGQSDYFEGVTHSICTLEFEVHRPLYEYFVKELADDSYCPRQIEFNRLNLTYTVMSKRKLLQLVKEGLVAGWDDPRMPTLVGLRRRGYSPEAMRLFCDRVGVSKQTGSWIDYSVLEGSLRDVLDAEADRRIAVQDPIKLIIDNYPEDQIEEFESPNHPQHPERGSRKLSFGKELWIERSDFAEEPPKGYRRLTLATADKPAMPVRLRHAYVVQATSVEKDADGKITAVHAEYFPETKSGTDGANSIKTKAAIHWLSVKDALPATIRLYDRLFTVPKPDAGEVDFRELINKNSKTVMQSYVEPSLKDAKPEDRFQFERNGYYVADQKDFTPDNLVFNLAVALKDTFGK